MLPFSYFFPFLSQNLDENKDPTYTTVRKSQQEEQLYANMLPARPRAAQ